MVTDVTISIRSHPLNNGDVHQNKVIMTVRGTDAGH